MTLAVWFSISIAHGSDEQDSIVLSRFKDIKFHLRTDFNNTEAVVGLLPSFEFNAVLGGHVTTASVDARISECAWYHMEFIYDTSWFRHPLVGQDTLLRSTNAHCQSISTTATSTVALNEENEEKEKANS
ncbi:hypothetical protein HDU76_002884, partial [Blyttiomyces sp. JEL0837]